MEQWIRDYKAKHPDAVQWARGSASVRHTAETQSRIFRMAEQLRVSQDWTNDEAYFALLHALDEVVDTEIRGVGRPFARSAAAAALAGYRVLFGTWPPSGDHCWPGFELVEDSEAELASIGLQATGFDPILIDGIDPAACLWGLFEVRERQLTCADVIRLQQHPARQPRCLAIVPQAPIAQPLPQVWNRSRVVVEVGS